MSNLDRRWTGLKTHSRIWSPVKIRQIEIFCLFRSNLARRLTGLKTHSRIWSPVKIRQIEIFCLFQPNRAWGLIGLKTVSNSNRPFDCSSNDGFTAERWKWMKNDTPERSVNRPFCHQSVNPTFSVRVWKKQIRSGNLEKRGWKLTKWPSRLQKWP